MNGKRIDGITIVAVVLLFFMGFRLLADKINSAVALSPIQAQEQVIADPDAFSSPYPEYVITQELHGYSYGHMAIDITAGKGAEIYSPIQGIVADLYVDGYNNTTLVIENARYKVTMLHGDYTVSIGQQLQLGDIVGTESNNGYTTDMYGRSCAGRNCGYHTHINVFDKLVGENIDPLVLLAEQ
jgi:hypothetical protein